MLRLMVKPREHVEKFFTEADKRAVVKAVQEAEHGCAVEFRVAVAHSKQKDIMRLASSIYKKLGIGKTKDEPGLLVLLLPARREFVLWGNEKVNQAISQEKWCAARDAAVPLLLVDKRVEAVRTVLMMLSKELAKVFPPAKKEVDELPDKPVEIP
jgi:uncharacterized membrane protein